MSTHSFFYVREKKEVYTVKFKREWLSVGKIQGGGDRDEDRTSIVCLILKPTEYFT